MELYTPPWYRGWNILFVGFCAQVFAVGLSTGTYGVYIIPISDEMESGRLAVTVGFSTLMIGLGVYAIPAGRAMLHRSIKGLMCSGAAILACGMILLSFAREVSHIIAVYALFIALGATLLGAIPASTLVANWFIRRRGRALGISAVGASMGSLVMPPIAASLISEYGWRDSYQYLAILLLVITLPLIWWIVVDKPDVDNGELATHEGAHRAMSENEKAVADSLTVAQVIKEKAFWAIACCAGLGTFVTSAIMVNVVPHAIDLGHGNMASAYLISAFTGGLIAGKLVLGALSEKIKVRLLWQSSLLCAGSGLLFMLFGANYTQLFLACALAGFGSGGYYPLIGMSVSRWFPPHSFSLVLGLSLQALYFISAPAAPVAAFVYDMSGSYTGAMWWGMVILVASSLAMALLGRESKLYGPVAN